MQLHNVYQSLRGYINFLLSAMLIDFFEADPKIISIYRVSDMIVPYKMYVWSVWVYPEMIRDVLLQIKRKKKGFQKSQWTYKRKKTLFPDDFKKRSAKLLNSWEFLRILRIEFESENWIQIQESDSNSKNRTQILRIGPEFGESDSDFWVGVPGAAPEGPKIGLFFKNFQILKENLKNGAQGGAPWRNQVSNDWLMFVVAWNPFQKKDGAKILIFYDFRNFLYFTAKLPPIDARGPQVSAID